MRLPLAFLKLAGMPMVCVAMFVVLGGHWAVLQGVAWSRMAIEYSRSTQSITEGLERTFSGKFPCGMCKTIAAAQQQEEQSPAAVKPDKKIESFVARTPVAILEPPSAPFLYPPTPDPRIVSRRSPPPEPVPIRA